MEGVRRSPSGMQSSSSYLPAAATPRPLRADDLPALLRIQQACYDDVFIESARVYARRLGSPANCSLVIERDGRVCAYLAAYRSLFGKITPLHGDFESTQSAPDTLYVHDMAVLPEVAGQGIAKALLESLWEQGRAWGLRHSALVSVQGSTDYWARHGYAAQAVHAAQARARLGSYGQGAVYMARTLDRA